MTRNIERMRTRLQSLGLALRPHVKTCKNIDIARQLTAGQPGGVTVSTLAEADYFFENGITDILYAVGIAPGKLAAVADRMARGMALRIILDHPQTATAVARAAREFDTRFRVLVEIDADGERAGLRADAPELIEIASILDAAGCHVDGVMVHAGGSYHCPDADSMQQMAETERASAVAAAERLRQAGHAAPVVSVGSTPTATFARDLTGATEVRAGVHVFQDLVQAGLGVCEIDDIAISVLTEVIGHRSEDGRLLVDAGWMALSRDRGTADQPIDQGYGLICSEDGEALDDIIVTGTNQEHGIVGRRDGSPLNLDTFPVGTRLRVLPNHACATAGQHDGYWIVGSPDQARRWLPRCRGW
ncbi:alanine racemase [Wenzhouxiangella sp. AB-CW3]|uniref:alanine racemase n=1 Tax=Wenzhouxiangella sp. AB-CW3 TaxID=2771012 RepID=UPI001CC32593|nr:alanine racemase [Wenzhouxiangella sp. AB-CW3]